MVLLVQKEGNYYFKECNLILTEGSYYRSFIYAPFMCSSDGSVSHMNAKRRCRVCNCLNNTLIADSSKYMAVNKHLAIYVSDCVHNAPVHTLKPLKYCFSN